MVRFSQTERKARLSLFTKKYDKQIFKNYRPLSLLPICGKTFKRFISNTLLSFFLTNNLNGTNQSGFQPGETCINQFLSVAHKIYKSFDDGLEIRGVSLGAKG